MVETHAWNDDCHLARALEPEYIRILQKSQYEHIYELYKHNMFIHVRIKQRLRSPYVYTVSGYIIDNAHHVQESKCSK